MVTAITALAAPATDPSAVAFASRRPGERFFCWEQPERDGTALAALGRVHSLEAEGPERFATVAEAWRRLAAGAVADGPDPGAGGLPAPRSSGLVARDT